MPVPMTPNDFKIACALAKLSGLEEETGLPAETIVRTCYERECQLSEKEQAAVENKGVRLIHIRNFSMYPRWAKGRWDQIAQSPCPCRHHSKTSVTYLADRREDFRDKQW